MEKILHTNHQSGSENANESRLLGSIVEEMLHSNSPLAVGCRQYMASHAAAPDAELVGWKHNTDLCVDVKTLLREDSITQLGKDYAGVLCRDAEDHYTFVQTLPCGAIPVKRNPHVFVGRHITVTRRDDGTYRLNFRPLRQDDSLRVDNYAAEVAYEIREALTGLVGEKVA